MDYLDKYHFLKNIYNEENGIMTIPGSEIFITNHFFVSNDSDLYPSEDYFRNLIYNAILKSTEYYHPVKLNDDYDCSNDFLKNEHYNFQGNKNFIYPIYRSKKKAEKVIILLHGLNESSWDKYHPWAYDIAKKTGSAVILFPISYHINRRPSSWSDSRMMNFLSKSRKNIYKNLNQSSFVNAAISTRLQNFPEFFFWSGLRTYNDILTLIKNIRNLQFDFISSDAKINFLGYSIGAFLTEILLMSNPNLFSDSKTFLFCGGPTMDLMYPASRYIYDTQTAISMTEFYVHNFENEIENNPVLKKYFEEQSTSSLAFRSMLNNARLNFIREELLAKNSRNIMAVALSKDDVIPPDSVRETLFFEGCDANFMELDFDYEYDHIFPFPLFENIRSKTDNAFNEIINNISDWFHN